MRVTNPNITELKPNEIFVFGSNLAGIHGAGAAALALEKFGAKWGRGEGFYGQSYAFPTKDHNIHTLPIWAIEISADSLEYTVDLYPEYDFLVTEVGCGLAGLDVKEIAPLFKQFVHLPNITLPFRFWQVLLQEKI